MSIPTVLIVFGTRPEAIKMAPVIHAFRTMKDRVRARVIVTAQHREMLDSVLNAFDIVPDIDLDIMRPDQTLSSLTARILDGMDPLFESQSADYVLVQGDTTTAMATALGAFHRRIPVGHIEAGLRTGDRSAPFPEEVNRRIVTQTATHHFAPTDWARRNLLGDGVDTEHIFVTGNTVIDALLYARDRIRSGRVGPDDLLWNNLDPITLGDESVVAITGHRRENFGPNFESICRAIQRLAERYPNHHFVYPVHLNPNVRQPVMSILGRIKNVHLIEPLGYFPFVGLMERSILILTDSGGIQEEAPSLGKPVLVMRETTERPEAVEAGVVRLVGSDEERIVTETTRLLDDPAARQAMSEKTNPYGDGLASQRIVETVLNRIQSPGAIR